MACSSAKGVSGTKGKSTTERETVMASISTRTGTGTKARKLKIKNRDQGFTYIVMGSGGKDRWQPIMKKDGVCMLGQMVADTRARLLAIRQMALAF